MCLWDQHNRQNTNLINFPMQILDLLIFCADTCSHTIPHANSQGTHGGLVHRHFTQPGQISCLFFLVTIETLYSRGDSRLICRLGMQIPSLSFAIENANTFRSKTLLKHSKMCRHCLEHMLLSYILFQLFKVSICSNLVSAVTMSSTVFLESHMQYW